MKRRRFTELHRAALRWPRKKFHYIGIGPEGEELAKAQEGEVSVIFVLAILMAYRYTSMPLSILMYSYSCRTVTSHTHVIYMAATPFFSPSVEVAILLRDSTPTIHLRRSSEGCLTGVQDPQKEASRLPIRETFHGATHEQFSVSTRLLGNV